MINKTRVKICGITNLADAQLAVELGAHMIGMIFWSGSPRCIDIMTARIISEALPIPVIPVGVFVEANLAYINECSITARLGAVQLHEDIANGNFKVPDIRVFSINSEFDFNAVRQSESEYNLLDTKIRGRAGGTGITFDWNLIPSDISRANLLLAGGLNPGNVAEAIRTVGPAIVDASSGLESSPGQKDDTLMREFFREVATANDEK